MWEDGIQSCKPYTAKHVARAAADKAHKLAADLHEMRAQIFMNVGKDFDAVKVKKRTNTHTYSVPTNMAITLFRKDGRSRNIRCPNTC